jgi:hypothetical protein
MTADKDDLENEDRHILTLENELEATDGGQDEDETNEDEPRDEEASEQEDQNDEGEG